MYICSTKYFFTYKNRFAYMKTLIHKIALFKNHILNNAYLIHFKIKQRMTALSSLNKI